MVNFGQSYLGYKIGSSDSDDQLKRSRRTDPDWKLNEHERNFIDYQLNTVANEFKYIRTVFDLECWKW